MTEHDLIKLLTRRLPGNDRVVLGAGDDCAETAILPGSRTLLLKTDAIVEGVHFEPDAPPEKIGHKALARCLSDLAAMGGRPECALVTLGLPAVPDPVKIQRIYDGLNALAERYEVAVVGGETTRTPRSLLLSVAVLGYAPGDGGVRRSGACVGDALFVTGSLGGSLAGRHLDFEPRVAEALWLTERFRPHAMIDISDGLARDLTRLASASGVGALIDADFIPVSRPARERARRRTAAKPPLTAALTDGEDYELLFALKREDAVTLKDHWNRRFPATPLSLIGRIEAAEGLRLKRNAGVSAIGELDGYDHFS